MTRWVAAHIPPLLMVGGVRRVQDLLQHVLWSGAGAGRDRLVSRFVVICCSLCCCCTILRSSEERLRRLSVRQGLVVTEVRCVCSGSVVAVGATGRGGDDNGVYVVGEGVLIPACWSSVGQPELWMLVGVACAGGPLLGTLAR